MVLLYLGEMSILLGEMGNGRWEKGDMKVSEKPDQWIGLEEVIGQSGLL